MEKFYRVRIYDAGGNYGGGDWDELMDVHLACGDANTIERYFREVLNDRQLYARWAVRLEDITVRILSEGKNASLRAYHPASERLDKSIDCMAKEYVLGTQDDISQLFEDRARMDDSVSPELPYIRITPRTLQRRAALKRKRDRMRQKLAALDEILGNYEVEQ